MLGRFLVDAWEGAVLRAKVDKTSRAIEDYFTMFDLV